MDDSTARLSSGGFGVISIDGLELPFLDINIKGQKMNVLGASCKRERVVARADIDLLPGNYLFSNVVDFLFCLQINGCISVRRAGFNRNNPLTAFNTFYLLFILFI